MSQREAGNMKIPREQCKVCNKWHQNMTFIGYKKEWYNRIYLCRYCKAVLLNAWKAKKC